MDREMDKDCVLKKVKEENVRFIRLWFTDILGQVKNFTITKDELEEALDEGMGFDGSSVTGYQDIEESDMVAMPDISTFRILPVGTGDQNRGVKEARMFCDILNPDGSPYDGDPRYILKKNLKRAEEMGFSYHVGPELEYFYFDTTDVSKIINDVRGHLIDRGTYFDMTPLDLALDLRRETVIRLEEMGIPVEYSHHEVGPSQHEIDLRYAEALRMADYAVTYRLIVKEVAHERGYYATFMPKPIFGVPGSGMHVHQSLFKDGRNAFFDRDDKYNLSEVGKGFIAGILKHSREICSVVAQWVNSYKRLVPGYEAPVYIAWSQRNRSALIRVPVYKPGNERATRIEVRYPDSACNPYLAFSVMLVAGLEGVKNRYELPEPMEKNLYELTPEEREERGIESLPNNLGEAIALTERSELVRETLGDHVFKRFISLKKEEWDEYRIQVSRYELERYLPIL
ncbi:MAG: type I glutamate--ammonia ligase [bacterium]